VVVLGSQQHHQQQHQAQTFHRNFGRLYLRIGGGLLILLWSLSLQISYYNDTVSSRIVITSLEEPTAATEQMIAVQQQQSPLSTLPPSIDRLLQLLDPNYTDTTMVQHDETKVAAASSSDSNFIYVNCATKTRNPIESSDTTSTLVPITPRSLQQCFDLMQLHGAMYQPNDDIKHAAVVTLVPRHDLFPQSTRTAAVTAMQSNKPSFALPKFEPMGMLHFHFSNDAAVQELERFATAAIHHDKVPYYAALGRTLGHAFGCEWKLETHQNFKMHGLPGPVSQKSSFHCPSWEQSAVVANTDSSSANQAFAQTWSVPHSVLAPVLPLMYQLPTVATSQQHTTIGSGKAKEPRSTAVDAYTPSVGVFRHAFVEMEIGRLLLHIPQKRNATHDDSSPQSQPQRHRQVLIQLNMCNEDKDLNSADTYNPFKGNVDATTTVAQAKASKVYDTAIVITSKWTSEFYHTTVENLPRLLLLKDFIESIPDSTIPIVVAASYRSTTFLYEYAKLWGLDHRLVLVGLRSVVYAQKMYIPEPSTCLALQPLMAQAHRHAIQDVIGSSKKSDIESGEPQRRQSLSTSLRSGSGHKDSVAAITAGSSKALNATTTKVVAPTWTINDVDDESDWIVVVRRNKTRYLRNHDGMMTALRTALPHEKWFVFDEGNIDGTYPKPGLPQWKVFARAKLVVAPHGAGLSNLLASRTGTHVVELLGNDKDADLCFLHLALALGMNYHPLHMMKQQVLPRKLGGGTTYEADIAHVVDVVTQIVQTMTASTAAATAQNDNSRQTSLSAATN
jgi:Glycosyltransferase 61